jgi:hypothetical protein
MALTVTLAIVGFTVAASVVLLLIALAVPPHEPVGEPASRLDDDHPRIRLLFRLLFARRHPESIVIDCLLVSVEQAGPGVTAPDVTVCSAPSLR